jgi:DNA-binding HxlR family transcriptional regulator
MLGNSRERDQLKPAAKRDRDSFARGNASEVRFHAPIPEECFAQVAVNLIQGKWKTRVLSRLQHGPARLGELGRLLPMASKKMLAQHLREMERDGLVTRTNLSGRVLHVEYSLSGSGGRAVLQLISMLQDWSIEHLPFKTDEQAAVGGSGANQSRPQEEDHPAARIQHP